MSQSVKFQVFKSFTVRSVGLAIFSALVSSASAAETAHVTLLSSKLLKGEGWSNLRAVRRGIQSAGLVEAVGKIEPQCTVESHRIQYRVPKENGTFLKASALIQKPVCAEVTSLSQTMLLYNHFTLTQKEDAPSANRVSPERTAIALLFAAYGSLVVMPDYFGLGSSEGQQNYLSRKTGEEESYYAIKAAEEWATVNDYKLNGKLFIGGYSQGAHVSLATAIALSKQPLPGIRPMGVAALSGPYALDKVATGLHTITNSPSLSTFVLMSVLTQFNLNKNGLKAEDAIRAEYLAKGEKMLAGELDFMAGRKAMPPAPAQLFTEKFYESMLSEGEDHFLVKSLSQESVDRSKIDFPILIYAAAADETVSSDSAALSHRRLLRAGNDVTFVLDRDTKIDHVEAALPALVKMRNFFFESLTNRP